MSHVTIMKKSQLFVAAAAIGTGGLLAAPAAHADSCKVTGNNLSLHQTNQGGYNVHVNANGSALGPRAVAVTSGGEHGTYGNASGGIAGDTVDFIITFDDNQGTAKFSGKVGADGIAHGTSTGPSIPINLWNPGPWDSTDPLNCGPAAGQKATATVKKQSDVYDAPDGVGNRLGAADYFLVPGRQLELVEPCRSNWCHLVIPDAQVPGGQGWVYQGEGYLEVK
jgi:hypothetical protein